MPTTDTAKLYGRWLALWNGELDAAEELVARDCVIHHPGLPPRAKTGRPAADVLRDMVRAGREPFDRLLVSLDVGPIEEGDKVAARWTARGSYRGGIPGATAGPGTAVEFSGIDLFRIADGRIAEYWVSSDALHLMQQLGAVEKR